MSKSRELPSTLPDEPAAPPSYVEATGTGSSSSHQQQQPTNLTAHLSSHLSSLPSLIRENHSAHQAHLAAQDADLMTLLAPEVDAFLASLSNPKYDPRKDPPPRTARLNLVPAAAVPKKWSMVEDDAPHDGDIVKVARVISPLATKEEKEAQRGPDQDDENADNDNDDDDDDDDDGASSASSGIQEPGFDEWGRWDNEDGATGDRPGEWWWRDEDMAIRLARHLQPQATRPTSDRQPARQAPPPAPREEKRSGFFGRFRAGSSRGAEAGPAASPVPAVAPRPQRAAAQQDASMTVQAEEVTFRRENEMGLWESMNGWAIVVRINIRR